ncbi:hypothetical protein H4S08_004851 [Coemansia sp. RSA 1365]|nr:hypothetical protein H4S08_004851 [Coemansia sp. RSA 1365]
MEYAQNIFLERELYDGFNLVLFDLRPEHMKAVYVTNRGDDGKGGRGSLRVLDNDSVTGLSNSTIDDLSWPKIRHGKAQVSEILKDSIDKVDTDKQDKQTITGLMELMRDTSPFNHDILPQRVEDLKQCIFVPRLSGNIKILANESYGTRSTNVLLLRESKLAIAECNYANDNVHNENNADTSIMQFNLSF